MIHEMSYLNVLELTNLEVAECDSWEPSGLFGDGFLRQTIDGLDSPHFEKPSKEGVENEEVGDDVNDIEKLGKQVQACQEGSLTFVAQETEFGSSLAHAHEHVPMILAVGLEPAVQVQGKMFDGLVTFLLIGNLSCSRHFHKLVHVDSRVSIEHSPYQTGELEKEGHKEKDERYPLVVGELMLLMTIVVVGNGVMHWDVVCILNPAVGLCVCHKRT